MFREFLTKFNRHKEATPVAEVLQSAQLPEDDKNKIESLVKEEIRVENELEQRKKEIESEIVSIQRSTRVSIPIFAHLHNALRSKYIWYYKWHTNPFSNLVHMVALSGYTAWLAIFVSTFVFSTVAPTALFAYSHQTWDSVTTWKAWKMTDLSVSETGQVSLNKIDEMTYESSGMAAITFDPFGDEVVDWLSFSEKSTLGAQAIHTEFSTDNILWTDDLGTAADSKAIYIRLTFSTTDPTITPLLDSLTVNFSRYPNAPDNLAFKVDQTILNTSQTMTAGVYYDPDSDAHKASQWQITDRAGNYEGALLDTGALSGKDELVSFKLAQNLEPGNYYFRVRYQDATGAWSLWSKECAFTISEANRSNSLVQKIAGPRIEVASLGDQQIPANSNEIIDKRTATAKIIDNKNGTYNLESYGGLIHYKENYADAGAGWKDINPKHYIDNPEYVLFDQMPSTVKVFKDRIGYEIESRESGAKYTVELQSVDGMPKLSKSTGSSGLVAWADINPPAAGNSKSESRNSKLADWIIPEALADTTATADDGNLKFEFEIGENGVRLWKTIEGADAPKNFTWKITKTGSGDDLSFRDKPDAYEVTNTVTDQIDTAKPIAIEAKKIDGDMDSSFTWQETAPKSDLKIDTDVVFNPDADPESTSVDGYVYREGTTNWSDIHGGGGTAVAADSLTTDYVSASKQDVLGTTYWQVSKGILLFDTSSLGAHAVITAGTLSVYGTSYSVAGGTPAVNVYSSNPTSPTAVATGDFSSLGSTAFSDAVAMSSWPTAYHNFTLNASGLGAINSIGVTKMGLREATYDVANTEPPFPGGGSVRYYSADRTGTSQDPKLSITYTVPTCYTVSGSGSATVNGQYNANGQTQGQTKYDGPNGMYISYSTYVTKWAISTVADNPPSIDIYYRLEADGPNNPLTGAWLQGNWGQLPTPTVTASCVSTINITGTSKQYNQSSNSADGETVKVAVNGVLQAQTGTTSSGTWTISGVTQPSANDVITVFIDGVADNLEANAVTKYDGTGNITGMALYEEQLTVGSDDNQDISNTNLSQYDNSVSSDEDIFFDVSGTALTVDSTAQSTREKLVILALNTLTPGGTITTHDMDINGTLVPEANTVNVGGSWDATGGTFTKGTSTVNLTTGGTITSDTEEFYNLTVNASSAAPYSLTNGLNAYWAMNGDATDSAGSNDGSTVNGAGFVSGKYGNALDLTASSSQYVTVPNNVSLQPTSAFTLTAWFYADSFPGGTNPVIASQWNNTGDNHRFQFYFSDGGTDMGYNMSSNGTDNVWDFSGRSYSAGTWYHAALVFDGSSQNAKIYIDGKQYATKDLGVSSLHTPNTAFLIGARQITDGAYQNYFDGKLDDVRVYSRALSAAEVASISNTYTLGDNLIATNNLNVVDGTLIANSNTITTKNLSQSGGVVNAPSTTMSVSGNFAHTAGTFTHNSGTVNLTGAGGSTQTITGSTTFNNLSATATSARTIDFASGSTQTVAGTWTVTGASGQQITLGRNGGSGTDQWSIAPNGTRTVSYVSVSNSNNTVLPVIDPTNSTDGGNTTNWFTGISISGTCDQYNQSTNCADGETVKVAVNGVAAAQTGTTATGAWTISGVTVASGDVVTVWIDGVADALEANAVTKYDGTGNITGMALYEEQLTIGSADNQTLSNTNLSQYDNSVSADEDIFFDVSVGGALTVDSTTQSTQEKLVILASNGFTPGGAVSTHDLDINGTLTPGSNTVTVSGSFDVTGGAYTPATSTLSFTSTSAGETIISDSETLNNVTFDGVGGGWTFSDTAAIAGNLTISNGTVVSPATMVLTGGFLQTSGNFTAPTGWTITGNFTHSGGTYTANSGTITFNSSDLNETITSTSAAMANVIFNGTGSWIFQDAASITGNVTVTNSDTTGNGVNFNNQAINIDGNVALNGGKLTSGSATINIAGNWTITSGTFVPNTGTVVLDGAGGSTQLVTGSTTFKNLMMMTASARTVNFANNSITTVTGTFTATGAAGQLLILGSPTSQPWFINPTAWSVSYVNVSYSTNQAASPINPTNSTDGGNNTNWFSAPAVTVSLGNSKTWDTNDELTNFSLSNTQLSAGTFSITPDDANLFLGKWGSAGSGNSQFNAPKNLATDSAGNVYIADYTNNRIQKFTSAGVYVTKWGTSGTGNGQFRNPYGVAVDASDNIYVSDYNNNRIQKFTSAGVYVSKFGARGSGNGQLYHPTGLDIDSSGNIYVAEYSNNRVSKFTSAGVYSAKWGTYGTGNGQFKNPTGVALDSSNNVYVADFNNNRIQKFTSAGVYTTKWGTNGAGNGQFKKPFGIASDSSNNIYVTDYSNNRIQKFSATGTFQTKWGSNGTGDGQFKNPSGVYVATGGNIYVTDGGNNRIQYFSLAVSGTATKLGYNSGVSASAWYTVSWVNTSLPAGASVKARVRASDTYPVPSDTTWSSYVTTSGGNVYLPGTSTRPTGQYADIEMTLESSNGSANSPILDLMTVSSFASAIAENGGTASITATLSGASSQNTVVYLSYSGAATKDVDYTSDDSITITAGSTSGTITLSSINDPTPEDNESLTIDIDHVAGALESGTQQISTLLIDNDYTITASAGANGSIDPTGGVGVNGAANQTFAITANAGYQISDVTVDGVSAGAVSSYTFEIVTANHTISATFTIQTFSITVVPTVGGTITPSGPTETANYGSDLEFTIAADTGYEINDVLVDGVSAGAVSSYTFTNITAVHTIDAVFSIILFPIDSTINGNGSITPAGETNVSFGGSQAYTIAVDAGYYLQSILVDNAALVTSPLPTTYTFTGVIAPRTIEVNVALIPIGTFTLTPSKTNQLSATPVPSVNLAVTDGMFSESASFAGASWQTIGSTLAASISAPDGVKTIYGKFKDQYGYETATSTGTTLLDQTGPAAPTNLAAVSGNSSISLTWVNPVDADFTKIAIFRSTTADFTPNVGINKIGQTDSPTIASYTDNSVVNGVTYYYKVEAIDNVDNYSTPSNQASGRADNDGPSTPGKPTINERTNVRESVEYVNLANSTLSWAAASDSNSGLASYYLSIGQVSGGTSIVDNQAIATNSYALRALADGTYYSRVYAKDNLGNVSANSPELQFVVDTIAPAITGDLTVTSLARNGSEYPVRLEWNVATDQTSGVMGYIVYRNNIALYLENGLTAGVVIDEASGKATFDDNLNLDAEVPYEIVAFDWATNASTKISGARESKNSIASIAQRIIDQTKNARDTIASINTSIAQITHVPEKAIPATTAAAAAAAATIGLVAAPIANAVTIFSLPEFLRSLFFSIFALGVRRREKYWGRVIEEGTGLPIPQAKLSLVKVDPEKSIFDSDKPVAVAYSDAGGRFAFIAEPGQYKIKVEKDMYQISNIPGYFTSSTIIRVKSEKEGLILPTIVLTMNPDVAGRKFEFVKRTERLEKVLFFVSVIFLILGTVTIVSSLLKNPHYPPTIVLAFVYPVLWYVNIRSMIKVSPFGNVLDVANRQGVSLALVRIMDEDGKHLVRTTVTNQSGKYQTLVSRGKYKVLISKPGYLQREGESINVTERMQAVNKQIEIEKKG